jgi:hypothetical protein
LRDIQRQTGKNMRVLLLGLTVLFAVKAGVVQGVTIENLSGRALARSRVRLQPVPQPASEQRGEQRPMQIRVERSGRFVFNRVPDGLYLLIAEREGYFPCAYGTRRPEGQGKPIQVTQDSSFFTELRMFHRAAITGRVLDENGVGISGVQVFAYRSRAPLRPASSGISDDRGVYRVHGLDPGKYWIRSASSTLDDGTGLLPTFGPESRDAREARVHEARLDSDASDADVRPEIGNLFRLGGLLDCQPLGAPVNVILSSETGRRTTQARCGEGYMFSSLAPSRYEVLAEQIGGPQAGYIELFADHDTTSASVSLRELPEVYFEVRRSGSDGRANIPLTLTGHRRDLSEVGSDREIKLPRDHLSPGHWELSASVAPGQYVESITSPFGRRSRQSADQFQSQNAFDIFVEYSGYMRVQIIVSDKVGQIAGKVTSDGGNAAGIPVFLWPVAEAARRSLKGYVQVLCDTDGGYRFDSLPPGDYLLLATSDVSEVDEQILDEARALSVHVEASQTASADLPVWIAP